MKKILIGAFLIIVNVMLLEVFADFQLYKDKLEGLGIQINELQKKNVISRYEFIKILNLSDCVDCLNPSKSFKTKYNSTWWNEFRNIDGNFFSDVEYENTFYGEDLENLEDYYYCIAYAGDKNYVNGYPQDGSPDCKGKFCGARNTSLGEFIDVLENILGHYVYNDYFVDWKKVDVWYNGLNNNFKSINNIHDIDKVNISNGLNDCDGDKCDIKTYGQFETYLKYCTFNTSECDFFTFKNIKSGEYPIAELNILYDNGIFSFSYIDALTKDDLDSTVSGDLLLEKLYRVGQKNQCSFDSDYDKDKIPNHLDNCINTYNPGQSDIDNDSIGDVCDDDIDGDTILNPKGIVDHNGNINLRLLLEESFDDIDNCIKVYNGDQKDSDGDGVGDACEDDDEGKGNFFIISESMGGKKGDDMKFKIISKSDIENIKWDFGNGKKINGKKGIVNKYDDSGNFKVDAKGYFEDGTKAEGKINVTIFEDYSDKVGFQIYAEKLSGKVPFQNRFKANYTGDVKYIEWNLGNKKKVARPDSAISNVFNKEGRYEIIGNAYNSENKKVAISKLIITAYDDTDGTNGTYGTNLIVSNTKPRINESIIFKTKISGFKESEINNVERKFGDGTTIENNNLIISKKYKENGTYIVRQKIKLKNGKVLENINTIYVTKNFDLNKTAYIYTDKTIYNIGEEVAFHLIVNENSIEMINGFEWNFGDYKDVFYDQDISEHLEETHIYKQTGVFKPRVSISYNDGDVIVVNGTVIIEGSSSCSLEYYSSLKCDMDSDGTPDICDDDIDGDGYPNFIGVLISETQNCQYTEDDFDKKILIDQIIVNQGSGEYDNCPIISNPDQIDIDGDGIGDECSGLEIGGITVDEDGDGIIGEDDLCPDVPENIDGVEDLDGCPEIDFDEDNIPDGSQISIGECFSCPCQYADYSSQIWQGDKVRAGIYDYTGEMLYKYSNPFIIKF